MPDIVGLHNSRQVFTPVVLLPAERFEDSLDPQFLSRPANLHVLNALIDTGATGTCITASAARKLGLEASGIVPVQGVGGASFHNAYVFKVGFVDLRKNELGIVSGPQFHLVDREISGVEFDCGSADFEVLLGMDVLSLGTLTVVGSGKFKFSF